MHRSTTAYYNSEHPCLYAAITTQVWRRLSWKARRWTLVTYSLLMFEMSEGRFSLFFFCCLCFAKSKCKACKEEMESQKQLAGLTDAGFEADLPVFWNDSFECFLVRLWSRLKRLKGHILLFLMGVQVHKPKNCWFWIDIKPVMALSIMFLPYTSKIIPIIPSTSIIIPSYLNKKKTNQEDVDDVVLKYQRGKVATSVRACDSSKRSASWHVMVVGLLGCWVVGGKVPSISCFPQKNCWWLKSG